MLKALGIISVIASLGFIASHQFTNPQRNKSLLADQKTVTQLVSRLALLATPEANYKNYCAGCHGEKMDAFVDRKWKHGSSEQDLFKAIKVGYPDDGMPGFDAAFTDDEIKDLVDYIVTGIKNVQRFNFNEPVRSNIFKTESLTIRLDTVMSGISIPWGMAFLPDGEMLVTERGGKIFRVSTNRELQPISGGPQVVAQGQGGLLDIELHPDFKNNQLVYLSYSLGKKSDSGDLATTAVMRAKLNGNLLEQQQNIFEALPYSKTRHHYGSRLEFDNNGYLYITVGDRGNHFVHPQSLKSYPGKIHRIKDDGSIPADNPFINTPDAVPSIYSYGHRNAQGMVMNAETGAIWVNEHGPRGGDEINLVQKAKNYGWPVICYGINYDGTVLTEKTAAPGMEQPALYWLPSIGPSGMAFVTGDRYMPWKGNLLVGSLRFKYLDLCTIKNNKVVKEEMLFKNIGRVRDVRMGPDGYIYLAVENPGAIFRLTPIKE
jgi:glucose/arabinose dehydrogenase